MKCPMVELHIPEALEDLWRCHEAYGPDAVVMGGGTDLIPRLKLRLIAPRAVVVLTRIPELTRVRFDPGEGLVLGSCVRLSEIGRHLSIRHHYPDLATAAEQVATPQVRNMGTLGGTLCQETRCAYFNRSEGPNNPLEPCFKRAGNVCHAVAGGTSCYAAYQGDLAPVLLARQAEVEIYSPGGSRRVPVSEIFSGNGVRPLALERTEVVTSVHLPPPPPQRRGLYQKFRLRPGIDFPLAGVAVTATRQGERLETLRVALTGVAQTPVDVDLGSLAAGGGGAEFLGQVAARARAAARPVANLESSPQHRRRMVETVVGQLLDQLAKTEEGAS